MILIGGGKPPPYTMFRNFEILLSIQKYIEIFVKISKIVLDKHTGACYHNRARVGELCPARTAMMQEIASKDGNFCGVCPVIGRLNCPVYACVYRRGRKRSALRRPFFLAWSDTHGGVNKSVRPYPANTTEYEIKEETKQWQTK